MNYARHRQQQKDKLKEKQKYLLTLKGEERTMVEKKLIDTTEAENEQNNTSDSGSFVEDTNSGREFGNIASGDIQVNPEHKENGTGNEENNEEEKSEQNEDENGSGEEEQNLSQETVQNPSEEVKKN